MRLLRRLLRSIAGLLLCGLLLTFYVFRIEPNWVQITELSIPAPGVTGEIRALVFGDVHIGMGKDREDLQKLVDQINALKPDMVFFLGDLFDDYAAFKTKVDPCIEILAGIRAEHKYAVQGNHDIGRGAQFHYADWIRRMGFVLLEDEAVQLDCGINLMGAVDTIYFEPRLEGLVTDGFDLLLSHEPDAGEGIQGIEWQISGHSHGGQVWIPFLLEEILPKGCDTYYRGLYEKPEGGSLYVNRGLGMSRLPVRFCSRPEITLLTIEGDR